MGRTVEHIGDNVVYFDCSDIQESFEWDDLQDNLISCLVEHYPSLLKIDRWVPYPYRESHIILGNEHISISVSEYCGCGSVSVFVDDRAEYPELAEHWLSQTWSKMRKLIGDCVRNPMRRIGTFSNGEAVFEKE